MRDNDDAAAVGATIQFRSVRKGALAPCPPFRVTASMVGTLPPSLYEVRRTSRFAHKRLLIESLRSQ